MKLAHALLVVGLVTASTLWVQARPMEQSVSIAKLSLSLILPEVSAPSATTVLEAKGLSLTLPGGPQTLLSPASITLPSLVGIHQTASIVPSTPEPRSIGLGLICLVALAGAIRLRKTSQA
jgi:hypothetical protein